MQEYSKTTLKVVLLTTTVISAPLVAQAQDDKILLEEIVVSARKTTESMQSVPISIQALGESKLEANNVGGFSDFTKMLPSVTIASVGPGNAQIYMRGISDGGDGNFSGTNPSVGVYLDDQPVTAIGRVLDIHMYDISRVEALSGPQGTLYGASSQAGTIRIITNAPDPSAFSAGIDISAGLTKKGEESYSFEGFVNVPISDNAAFRVVGWHVSDGGYIDNVKGEKIFTVDGLNNAGQPATSRITVTNDEYLEKDFNDEKNTGVRAALKIDMNDSWTATAKLMHQKQKTKGVWDHDPEDVGDLEVQRFFEDRGEDKFSQAALTIEGEVAGMDIVYAGSYLDRDVQYDIDYSEYAAYSSFIPYYTCDFDANYYFLTDTCTDPRIQYDQESKYKVQTHELRLQSDQNKNLRFITGLFYQDAEHAYDNQWRIPTIRPGKTADDNFTGNVSGHFSDSYFITDQIRSDKEKAIFSEVTYDISEKLSATVGARFFKSSSQLEGVVATFWWNGELLDLDSSESSSIFKLSLDYKMNEDVLLYGTVSEGFRPGGNNRVTGTSAGATYDSDLITNYEFGWKSTLADGRARFNGSIFLMDWSDIQLTRFDPSISLLGLTANVGSAEVKGVETDLTVAATNALTLSASMSYIDASLSENYAVDVANIDTNPDAPAGTRLSMVPKYKMHMSARQAFDFMDYNSFFQASLSHQGSSYNDFFINSREKQAGFTIVDLSLGIDEEDWSLTIFAENLFDERAEMYRNAIDYDSRITTNRPRSITLRYSKHF